MFTSIRLPTYSRYEGFWNPATNNMDGFGCYTFPDGSIYNGYFRNGLFQGAGTIKLFYPQKFIMKAVFDKGKCVEIEELTFGDGLEFVGKFCKDGTLDSNKWQYCNKNDRLYYNETRTGLLPPGPHAYLTAHKEPLSIPKGAYDTSHGIFFPSTGFITFTEETGEKSKHSFIGCSKDREYIQKNYRLSKGTEIPHEPIEPSPEISQQIIQCNIAAMCNRYETASCRCQKKAERDRYFNNLCKKHMLADKNNEEQHAEMSLSDCDMTTSSTSIPSFGDDSDPCKQDLLTSLEYHEKMNKWHKSEEKVKENKNSNLYRQKEALTNIIRFSIYPAGRNARPSF